MKLCHEDIGKIEFVMVASMATIFWLSMYAVDIVTTW